MKQSPGLITAALHSFNESIGQSVVLPGSGAVSVEDVKVLAGEELAAIDTRLNGAQSAKNAHLFHVANERHDVEALQFGVDRVEAANQVLEEEFKSLWQAEHRLTVDDESGHFLIAIIDQFALIGRRIGTRNRWRTVAVAVRRTIAVVVATAVTSPASVMPVAVTTQSVVAVVAVKRTFNALHIGSGCGCSSSGGSSGRMTQVQTRMISVRNSG